MLLGWINIYSSVYDQEHQSIFDTTQRYGKQLIWIGAAIVLGFFLLIIESNFYVFFSWIFYGVIMILLLLVLLFGTTFNAAKALFMIGL